MPPALPRHPNPLPLPDFCPPGQEEAVPVARAGWEWSKGRGGTVGRVGGWLLVTLVSLLSASPLGLR